MNNVCMNDWLIDWLSAIKYKIAKIKMSLQWKIEKKWCFNTSMWKQWNESQNVWKMEQN